MGGYDGIPSMNHLGSIEINDSIDFFFFNFFGCTFIPNNAIPCHFTFFAYAHKVMQMKICKSSSFSMRLWALCGMLPTPQDLMPKTYKC